MKTIRSKSLFILTLLISLLFTACSEKSATKYSNKNPQYAQLAKYTQIAKIVVDNEVKAIANITYLNGSMEKEWDDGYQHFLVGVYGLKELNTKNSLQMLLKEVNEINDEVDEKLIPFIEKRKISQEDPLSHNIPFKNSWASYTLVKFEDIEDRSKIVLRFMLDEENYQDITFLKE